MTVRILQGDCLDVLRTLPDASVHCCVTSPPYYGLRNYGVDGQIGLEATPDDFVAKLVEVFREVRRVLRDDGTLWLNLGDSYNNFRSQKGPGQGVHGRDDLRGKPEPLSGGRGWSGLKEKDLLMMPARVALALQGDGWWLRSAMPWIKRSCMPESTRDRPTSAVEYVFMLTKKPRYYWDAVAVQQKGAVAAGVRAAKGSNVRSELKDVNGRPPEYWDYTGTRQFRNSDLFMESLDGPHGLICDSAGHPIVLDVNPMPFADAHFATFSPNLIAPLIAAGTSERGCCPQCAAPWVRQVERQYVRHEKWFGEKQSARHSRGQAGTAYNEPVGITTTGWAASCQCDAGTPVPCVVLDPFAGAFTTCLVADRLQRNAIGIELNPAYCDMARRRIEQDAGLFAEVDAGTGEEP